MTDMMNFHSLPKADDAEEVAPTIRPLLIRAPKHAPIGRVVEIGGGGGRLELIVNRMAEVSIDPDPSIALSGQVGGHCKVEVGQRWLLERWLTDMGTEW